MLVTLIRENDDLKQKMDHYQTKCLSVVCERNRIENRYRELQKRFQELQAKFSNADLGESTFHERCNLLQDQLKAEQARTLRLEEKLKFANDAAYRMADELGEARSDTAYYHDKHNERLEHETQLESELEECRAFRDEVKSLFARCYSAYAPPVSVVDLLWDFNRKHFGDNS